MPAHEAESTPVDPKTGVEWVPAFDRQRPPFQPGNQLAVTHGIYSKTRTDPVALRYIEEVCSDPNTAYVNHASYSANLWLWGTLMAQIELITDYMADMTFEDATNSERGKTSPMDLLTRLSGRALALAKDMGFTPKSRASMGKDVAQGRQASITSVLGELRAQAEQDQRDKAAGTIPSNTTSTE